MILMQKPARQYGYSCVRELYTRQYLLMIFLAVLTELIRFIYPNLNEKINDFRKNI